MFGKGFLEERGNGFDFLEDEKQKTAKINILQCNVYQF